MPSSVASEGTTKKTKKGRQMRHFPARVEQDLADWYKTNSFLYNLTDDKYKDIGKKRALLEEKAKELTEELEETVTKQQLETWLKSMRSTWGRLSLKKSGSAAKKLTTKEEWILVTFGFLKKHIHRRPQNQKMTSGKVCTFKPAHVRLLIMFTFSIQLQDPEMSSDAFSEDEGSEVINVVDDEEEQPETQRRPSRPPSRRPSRPSSRQPSQEAAAGSELSDLARSLKDHIDQRRLPAASPQERHLDTAFAYGKSVIMALPENLWRDAADDFTLWVLKWAKESRGCSANNNGQSFATPTPPPLSQHFQATPPTQYAMPYHYSQVPSQQFMPLSPTTFLAPSPSVPPASAARAALQPTATTSAADMTPMTPRTQEIINALNADC